MASRLLLALLALLTGLSVEGTSARAQETRVEAAQLRYGAALAEAGAARRIAVSALPFNALHSAISASSETAPALSQSAHASAVLTGIDRARE